MDIAADRDPRRTNERPAGGKSDALISALWPGEAYPRGATWDGEGVNFSLFSAHAEKVELCIFDGTGRREIQRLNIRERTDGTWHAFCPRRARVCCMVIACTDRTIRSVAIASIRTSC